MDELDLGATIRGFSPGQKVFNRYVLVRQLGRGGMGVVWLARDESLEREVAIKMLPEIVANDPVAVKELKRETAKSQRLSHPRILRIFDFVESGPLCGITMEYVEGGTLAAKRLEQPGEVFGPATLGKWVRQLCEALAYAHGEVQIVHRDLKPANLMIDRAGDLKVADFGIAASMSDSVSRVSLQGGSSGTPVYMSPQQMMGDKPAVTDDLYALGATLYELLTGKPPFFSGNIILQVQSKVPPSMTGRRAEFGVKGEPIPEAWEATIAACLAKEPKDRPQSAEEVAKRLQLNPDKNFQPGFDTGKSFVVSGQPRGKSVLYVGMAVGLVGLIAVIWFGFRGTARSGALDQETAAPVVVPAVKVQNPTHTPETVLQPLLPVPAGNIADGVKKVEVVDAKQAPARPDPAAIRPAGVPAQIQTESGQQQILIKKLEEVFGLGGKNPSEREIQRMEAALAEAASLVPRAVLSPYREQLVQAKSRHGDQSKMLAAAETKVASLFMEMKLLEGATALAGTEQMAVARNDLPAKLAELRQAWAEWVEAGGDANASMYVVRADKISTTITLPGHATRAGVAGVWAAAAGEHSFTVQPSAGAARTAVLTLTPSTLAIVDERGRLQQEHALGRLPQADQRKSGVEVYDVNEVEQRPIPRVQNQPLYPFEMRRAGIEGEVVVEFVVDTNGDVRNPFVVRSTQHEFEASAIQAVSRWKFQPGRVGGEAVNTARIQQLITFKFDE